jgi:hypothetical protein
LEVTAPTGFSSLDAVVLFDPTVLERPRARRTASGRQATIAANAPTPGRLIVALASARPMTSGTVALLELRRVDATTPPGPILESADVGP